MKVAYFDCTSGASGDMLLAAVLDSLSQLQPEKRREGVDEQWLAQIEGLLSSEQGASCSAERVKRGGLSALKIDFLVSGLHADSVRGQHRTLVEIEQLIREQEQRGRLPEEARLLSLKIFEFLARAEAKVHGTDLRSVHFHEVGAFDSVMDVVGFAAAFSLLEVDQVFASEVTLGSGTIECAHGMFSVPPPAVVEIVSAHKMPVSGIELPGECLTPTGAAILAAVVKSYGPLPKLREIRAQGLGAGTREMPGKANVVRLIVGEV